MKILSDLSCVLLLIIGFLASGCKKLEDVSDKKQKSEDKILFDKISKNSQEKAPKTANTQIICNEFNLVANVTNSTLEFSVNTDLPDNTAVMVSVSRSYLVRENSERYSVDYFSEKSTVGKWKLKHKISIDSENWKTALKTKKEKLSRIGLGFDVASISDEIEVRMVVPINQPDPKFGERNSNLTGKAVIMASKGGKTVTDKVVGPMYIVKDELKINYPLDSSPVENSPFLSLNPQELKIGHSYIVSKQTPLMPYLDPADPMEAIQQIKQIPKEGIFEVLETAKKNNSPWYKVIAFDHSKQQIGTGWINSTALIGQELKVYN